MKPAGRAVTTSESYEQKTTGYVVAHDMKEALERAESARESTYAAWADLGYWAREEHADEYSVFEVEVVKKVRKLP